MEDGQVIKLKAYGAPGVNGGPNGDLYITFVIAADPHYKRLSNDLYMNMDIDLYTAVLGADITLDTLSGKIKLKVNPETQNGTKIRLKGKGFPVYKNEGQFGDLYVTYNIKIPTSLTDAQKELFKTISKILKKYRMSTDELVAAEDFCTYYSVNVSFINTLHQLGLVEIVSIEERAYIPDTQLPKVEQLLRLHFDLEINYEGLDVVNHLLEK